MMSSSIKKRDKCTSQSLRTFIVRDYSPGPCAYNSKSFLEQEKKRKVGPTIAQAERLNERSREVVPGPGAYSPKEIKETKLSYTMSPRLENPLSKSVSISRFSMSDRASTKPKSTTQSRALFPIKSTQSTRRFSPSRWARRNASIRPQRTRQDQLNVSR